MAPTKLELDAQIIKLKEQIADLEYNLDEANSESWRHERDAEQGWTEAQLAHEALEKIVKATKEFRATYHRFSPEPEKCEAYFDTLNYVYDLAHHYRTNSDTVLWCHATPSLGQ